MSSVTNYIPKPENKTVLYTGPEGDTSDIMAQVMITYRLSRGQLQGLVKDLKGSTLMETCKNVWEFVKKNISYKVDPPGYQYVKTPARLWSDRVGDCKSYSIFIACCLDALGVPGIFRFVSFKKDDPTPTHVYVVVKPVGKSEIILDAVMPRFNQEKAWAFKQDYPMTQIARLSGISKGNGAKVGGFIQNTFLAGKRKQVLFSTLPGIAILMLYGYIPAGPDGGHVVAKALGLGTSDNLLANLPGVVARKRSQALDSFWDFGDWANITVETDLFPKVRAILADMLGTDPQDWWRTQLSSAGIGDQVSDFLKTTGYDPASLATSSTKFGFKNFTGFMTSLFGGTDITWKRGAPGTWAPADADWSGFPVNPLSGLNLSFDASSGKITPTPPTPITYPPQSGGGTQKKPNNYSYNNPNPQTQQAGFGLVPILIIAAIAAAILFGGKGKN